ncbi:MAG: hypothetical protein V3R32_03985, partial [Nitrosomonadaceae bacterium]
GEAESAIPGLGDVPLGLFFLILLVFAVCVGPVNYFYWRRRRRLAMLLLTVPVAGFTRRRACSCAGCIVFSLCA